MSRQHYVSRFHLSAFCDPASTGTPDPWLWIGSTIDQSVRRRSPKNVAAVPGLFDGPGGFSAPGASLETFLANDVEGPLFVLSVLAIVPFAALLSHATESVASRTGDAVGDLLNGTLGNLTSCSA